ncbi:50S ribosomal protein L24 [Halorhodospira halochloris]|uniref:Large ribosomal subunit protein uL24 n=1 Tax=Halorhodospira halochloris TaxID=1052 RepID=A0A0X8XC06_HALHR|nr:50S ribosomal protein L24 [Halorhodospira halochloris]MBK1652802.1 50S ribosomal protein L24 [Halorhodospira halochloris]MCG5530815.1 50S ribosomal protein L24 [Halorhodospira halochloris]MCG5549250.1 50S ribosomal protein L24 [Halorhodospira halochloris]BAU58923.2 LSU ribosomal protein L24p [Halorhodospira halochloris]
MRKIRKGDEVVVIAGKDRGRRGRVSRVFPDQDKVVVDNVNMVKRHRRGNPMQGSSGGIIEQEAPIHISNVAIYNPETDKPDRVGIRWDDDRKVRYFKSNQQLVDA